MPCSQVYDDAKKLKRTLDLIEPVIAASWLNVKGDIVAALERNLVVIRADTYQFLSQDELVTLIAEHTKGAVPSPLPRQATLQKQLSMIPPALCDDFLTHLMTLSADARLSIFDVPLSPLEVNATAVVARVAHAAKTWRHYKSAASSHPSSGAADSKSQHDAAGPHGNLTATRQHSNAEVGGDDVGVSRLKSNAAASSSAAPDVSSHAAKQNGSVGWGGVVGGEPSSAHGSRHNSLPPGRGPHMSSALTHTGRLDPGNVNMHIGVMNR